MASNFWGSQGRFGSGMANPQQNQLRRNTNFGVTPGTGQFDQNFTQQLRGKLQGLIKNGGGGGASGSLYGARRPNNNVGFAGDPSLGGYQSGPWSGTGAYEGADMTPPEGLGAGMVDPGAVIKSFMPGIEEKRDIGWAQAAQNLSTGGPAEGTPWAHALGTVQRGADNDMANVASKYAYDAATDAARRQQDEWKTSGNWEMDAQREKGRRGEWEWGRKWDTEGRNRQWGKEDENQKYDRMMAEMQAGGGNEDDLRNMLLQMWQGGQI